MATYFSVVYNDRPHIHSRYAVKVVREYFRRNDHVVSTRKTWYFPACATEYDSYKNGAYFVQLCRIYARMIKTTPPDLVERFD